MKTIRLPNSTSEHIHLECFRSDGSSYCIQTKHCNIVTVEDDVVDVVLTQMDDRLKLRMSRGWQPDRTDLRFKQKVDFVLA